MNINRLLENAKRISLMGKNIYTQEGLQKDQSWMLPAPGFSKRLYVGHELPIYDVLVPVIEVDGRETEFLPVRHQWTPAWSKTYYRSQPDPEYYPVSGCFSYCETKCFTKDDVFVSRIQFHSDKREASRIQVKLVSSLPRQSETKTDYLLDCQVKAGAVGMVNVKGIFAQRNTVCEGDSWSFEIPANGSVMFEYAFAYSKEGAQKAEELALEALKEADPFEAKEAYFNAWMSQKVPTLECEDLDILKMYYYRWFVVYRGLHCPSDVVENHPVEGDCFYESPYGLGYNCPIGLPVPKHLEEGRWMICPDAVYSDAYNWSRELDCYHLYYLQYTPMTMWQLYENHPDPEFLKKVYPSCKKYALKDFRTELDEYAFLPRMTGSWCTGAEYQPAFYQYTDNPWDWTCDTEGYNKGLIEEIRTLYRLDHISYAIGNLMGCKAMASQMGYQQDAEELEALIQRSVEALKKYFWNEQRHCFVSIDAATGKQCDQAACYDTFYPFLWGLIGEGYDSDLNMIWDTASFASDFGITSVEKECPMYWFDNCIAGPEKSSVKEPHPYVCSWNGPVWPYAVSGVADALGHAAYRQAASENAAKEENLLTEKWLELFANYTEVQFWSGDRSLPLVTEHYRPTDGVSFSATCDYFHSSWINLFIQYWAGIHISGQKPEFTPFAKCEFTLKNVPVNGKLYEFSQKLVDGEWKREVKERAKNAPDIGAVKPHSVF